MKHKIMNNYKVKPASSTRSAMLKMEQQISDNLSSVRDSSMKTIKECKKTIEELTIKKNELERDDILSFSAERTCEITNLRHMINENKKLIAWHKFQKTRLQK